MRIIPMLAVLALSIFGNGETAFAQQPQPPSAGRPVEPIPTLLTMNQKVAMANHIFIGTGKRVYFIDRFYKEVPFELASGASNSRVRSAILEVETDRHLYSASDIFQTNVARFFVNSSIEQFGNRLSGQDELSAKYIGKPMIYFTNAYIENIHDFEKDRAPIVDRIPMHSFVVTLAVSGPTANPLPLSNIQEIMQAINARIDAESRAKR